MGIPKFFICRPCREGKHTSCWAPRSWDGEGRCVCDTCDSIREDARADLIDRDREWEEDEHE